MAKCLSKNDFIAMPWKNGKGETLELYRLSESDSTQFLFRISMANVNTDGPFSIFPGIDRILYLTSGQGMILRTLENEVRLTEKWKPFRFSGEEKIECQLIDGPCKDFNIMVDRNFAKVQSLTHEVSDKAFVCMTDFQFIFNPLNEQLFILEKNESFHFRSDQKTFLLSISLTR